MTRLEFRDGDHDVPDHVAALLRGIDTYQYTYRQAIELSNTKLLKDRLDQAQKDLVRSHMERYVKR